MNGDLLVHDTRGATAVEGATGYLTIDLSALGRNYQKLSAMLAPARAAAVVKADAYGLGAEPVAKMLYAEGCRHFFVAQFVEALRLRPSIGHDAQIFVLNGLQPGNQFACAENGIIPVLNSLAQYRQWSETASALKRTLPAVLQFDTGMSRLGLAPEERQELTAALRRGGQVEILFVMSHLASADDVDDEQNAAQLAEMTRITDEFAGLDISFANSGGVFLGDAYHGVLARPGIALYGGAPNGEAPNPMEPVVSLDVAVVQTRTVAAGSKVGYGGAHLAHRDMRLAALAAGYADGLPRSLGDRGAVYAKGVRLPIIGRVSMDSMTVDISALPEGALQLGDRVEVLGPHQTIEDVARDADTISYEILTRLGNRYHRQYR